MPRWTRSTSSPIYTPEPVAREHHLNGGLVGWWMGLPHLTGGKFYYDLSTYGRKAALNSVANVSWATQFTPGGFGGLRNTSNNWAASVSDGSAFSFSDTTFTVSHWLLPLNTTGETAHLAKGNGSYESKGWLFTKGIIRLYNGTGILGTASWTYAANTWYHVTAVFTTSTTVSSNNAISVYINGQPRTTTFTPTGTYSPTTNALGFGGITNGGGGASVVMDDVRIWSRGLSAGSVAELYDDACRGYPRTIRRARTVSVVLPAVVAATASLSATLGSLTLVGTATSTAPSATTASLSVTLGSLTATATATTTVATTTGTLSATLGGLTLAANAAFSWPEDLYEAIISWFGADATLTSIFGRQNWLWVSEAPDGEPFPYAVITQPESDLSFSSTDDTQPTVESATYQVSIFSNDRQLNRAISARIIEWLSQADLIHNDGYLMSLIVSSQVDLLDPDRGPGGADVWQRAVIVDVREGHNQAKIEASYSPTPSATDLADALVAMLAGDSTLASGAYFGRAGWLWMQESPQGQALPYGVLVQTDSQRRIETASIDSTRPVIERAEYECHIYASGRVTCRMLGERIAALLDGADLTFGDGYLMSLRRQSDTDTLDDDRSRLGADVWHRVVSITAITGHTE